MMWPLLRIYKSGNEKKIKLCHRVEAKSKVACISTFQNFLTFPENFLWLWSSQATCKYINWLFKKTFLKETLFIPYWSSSKDLLVHMPAPSSVELMSQTVCFCLFFILSPISSTHAFLVYDLLPFRVIKIRNNRETCNDAEHFSLDPEWQQIINKKSMRRGKRRENEKETETTV